MQLELSIDGDARTLRVDRLVVAGFTGRDRAAVEHHIEELARLGVTPPERVPAFYVVDADALRQDGELEAAHDDTSGEAEIAIVELDGERYVTLASDHTDRRAEAEDIALSKRCCPKPIATEAWRFADVEAHWDRLQLRSWIEEDGARVLYQDGTAGELLGPAELLEAAPLDPRCTGGALLCGTVGVIGTIRGAASFEAELHDPVAGRTLRLAYRVRVPEAIPSDPGRA